MTIHRHSLDRLVHELFAHACMHARTLHTVSMLPHPNVMCSKHRRGQTAFQFCLRRKTEKSGLTTTNYVAVWSSIFSVHKRNSRPSL